MRITRHIHRCFLVVALLLSSTPVAYAASPSVPAPLAKLIEEAKKEGTVTVYGSYTYDEAKEIHAAFNKHYPFIKFEHLSMGAGDVVTRVLMESKAGTAGADVALTGAPMFLPLVKEGFLRQNNWASLGVSAAAIDAPWGLTCATVTYVLASNTTSVPRADAPKNWNDLLNPKWKGNVGLWINPNPFGDLIPAMGEAKVTDYLKKLMQNNPVIIRGGAEIPARIAAGEISVGVVIDATLRRVVEKGAPIEWVWPDPVPVERLDAAVTKLARNPSAAALYCIWLASPEGAATYEKATGRGNVFVSTAPIAQKTKGKKYSYWPTERLEERQAAIKRLTQIIAP